MTPWILGGLAVGPLMIWRAWKVKDKWRAGYYENERNKEPH